MQRLPNLIVRNGEDKPAWATEIIKALFLAGAVWALTAWLSGRGQDEHRFTALETETSTLKEDVKEIKHDVKDILKAVK